MIEDRVSLERVVAGLVERVERRFYGKYRGFVVDDKDPSQLARLKLRVPSVLGEDVVTGWANPCVPYGGLADQGVLFLPKRDAGVWVEFEEGDLEFPIWVGTFWSRDSKGSGLPRPNASDGSEAGDVQDPVTRKIIKTAAGHTLQFEDADGKEAVLLRDGRNGHRVVLDADGVALVDGIHGHEVRLTSKGISITDGVNKNTIVLGSDGIGLGEGADQSIVLGDSLKSAITSFITDLNLHTHPSGAGPTGPPAKAATLDVPLSAKNKVK
jgi:hypothetical protein